MEKKNFYKKLMQSVDSLEFLESKKLELLEELTINRFM